MERSVSYQRVAALTSADAQALRGAQAVVNQHTQWVLSHLSAADRELIKSVTGEDIALGADTASTFALTLAESRVNAIENAAAAATQMLMTRPQPMTHHDRVATFTSMRAMLGNGSVGRALDTEA